MMDCKAEEGIAGDFPQRSLISDQLHQYLLLKNDPG
jgi:hypothetical protein